MQLESLILFQKRLQENIDNHIEIINHMIENFDTFVEQLSKTESTLKNIQSPLVELQNDIEFDKSAVQFALHTKNILPKEQKDRIDNLDQSIQEYEKLNNNFNNFEDTLRKIVDDINEAIRKYQESYRYVTS